MVFDHLNIQINFQNVIDGKKMICIKIYLY